MDQIIRKYSFFEKIYLAYCLLKTKCQYSKVRLIRFPIVVRGKNFIDFGVNLTTGVNCRIEAFTTNDKKHKRVRFGNNIQINDYVHISALECVEIGDNCLMASHIYISDNSHGRYEGSENDSYPFSPPAHREYITSPVKIGKNCWLGEGVIVMPGVTIGDGCIIGAHSVVKHDIPPASIAVGSPARVVKRYNFEIKCWEKISHNSIK